MAEVAQGAAVIVRKFSCLPPKTQEQTKGESAPVPQKRFGILVAEGLHNFEIPPAEYNLKKFISCIVPEDQKVIMNLFEFGALEKVSHLLSNEGKKDPQQQQEFIKIYQGAFAKQIAYQGEHPNEEFPSIAKFIDIKDAEKLQDVWHSSDILFKNVVTTYEFSIKRPQSGKLQPVALTEIIQVNEDGELSIIYTIRDNTDVLKKRKLEFEKNISTVQREHLIEPCLMKE